MENKAEKKSAAYEISKGLTVRTELRLRVVYECDESRISCEPPEAFGKIPEGPEAESLHLRGLGPEVDVLEIEYRDVGDDPCEAEREVLHLSDEEPKPGDLVVASSREDGFSVVTGRLVARRGSVLVLRSLMGTVFTQVLNEGNAVRKILDVRCE